VCVERVWSFLFTVTVVATKKKPIGCLNGFITRVEVI
jgi:hypothetical protein